MTNDDIIIARLTRDLHICGLRMKEYDVLVWEIRDAIHMNKITAFNHNKLPELEIIETMTVDKKDYEALQKIKELIRNFK